MTDKCRHCDQCKNGIHDFCACCGKCQHCDATKPAASPLPQFVPVPYPQPVPVVVPCVPYVPGISPWQEQPWLYGTQITCGGAVQPDVVVWNGFAPAGQS